MNLEELEAVIKGKKADDKADSEREGLKQRIRPTSRNDEIEYVEIAGIKFERKRHAASNGYNLNFDIPGFEPNPNLHYAFINEPNIPKMERRGWKVVEGVEKVYAGRFGTEAGRVGYAYLMMYPKQFYDEEQKALSRRSLERAQNTINKGYAEIDSAWLPQGFKPVKLEG